MICVCYSQSLLVHFLHPVFSESLNAGRWVITDSGDDSEAGGCPCRGSPAQAPQSVFHSRLLHVKCSVGVTDGGK